MEETPVDCINRPDKEGSTLLEFDQDIITVSEGDIHNHEGYNPALPGYMRPLRRSPSTSVENPAPGHYDVEDRFGVYSSSRLRNSISHSMRSREGWDKVVISKHHTQERKGIGTPGVGSYSLSPRSSMSSRSTVIRPSCSPRNSSLSSRSWLPFCSVIPSSEQGHLNVTGISFPKSRRQLGVLPQHDPHYPLENHISSIPLVYTTSSRQKPPAPHVIPSREKSSSVSGLFMPKFARHSRSMSFSRATRVSPRSLSPRFSPWSPKCARQISIPRAPKFGSPSTRPRLDFRNMMN